MHCGAVVSQDGARQAPQQVGFPVTGVHLREVYANETLYLGPTGALAQRGRLRDRFPSLTGCEMSIDTYDTLAKSLGPTCISC